MTPKDEVCLILKNPTKQNLITIKDNDLPPSPSQSQKLSNTKKK